MLEILQKQLLLLLVVLLPSTSFASQQAAVENRNTNYPIFSIKQILLSKPEAKATVGVIPYLIKDNKTYILLGREDINGKDSKKAGTYCALGGSVNISESFLENMLRELKEETMGLLTPKAQYVLEQSMFLIKQSNNGRKIIYGLVPAREGLYKPAFALNEYRRAKINVLSAEELEKDQYVWLDLSQILIAVKTGKNLITVKDIDNQQHEITLRKYFVEDFLMHPELPKIQVNLK